MCARVYMSDEETRQQSGMCAKRRERERKRKVQKVSKSPSNFGSFLCWSMLSKCHTEHFDSCSCRMNECVPHYLLARDGGKWLIQANILLSNVSQIVKKQKKTRRRRRRHRFVLKKGKQLAPLIFVFCAFRDM